MNNRINHLFIILVFLQGLHSIEEYYGRLWDTFSPAVFLTGLVSANHETGYLIINIGLFIFGLLCWFFPVRKNYFYADVVIWFWIIIELINGIGHPLWAIYNEKYSPGLLTAPFLLIVAVFLFIRMINKNPD